MVVLEGSSKQETAILLCSLSQRNGKTEQCTKIELAIHQMYERMDPRNHYAGCLVLIYCYVHTYQTEDELRNCVYQISKKLVSSHE